VQSGNCTQIWRRLADDVAAGIPARRGYDRPHPRRRANTRGRGPVGVMTGASEQRDRGVRRLFVSAVVVPITLAVIAAAWFAWQIERISAAADFIDLSDRVIALVGNTQRLIADQELGIRSFVFTENPIFLEPYRPADVDDDMDELDHLLSAQPAQAAESRAFRGAYHAWRQHAEEAIASPALGWGVAAMRARNAHMNAIRAKGKEIIETEKSTRLTRTRSFERETRVTTIGAVALLALLAGVSSLVSRRQIRLIGALATREREALRKAHEALRAKDAFLANLSHELRTPLTPILGWVSMARNKPLRGEALDRALAVIERNARAEAQIVDDVLDISRIAAGDLRIAPEPVDPEAIVRAAIDVVELSARAKAITIEAAITTPLPVILGEPARLQQVVWTLLSNAVKFTPRGGHVQIRVDRCNVGARIRVIDDGEGIAADFLPHVFAYFRQADPSMTRAHGGLGLGLAIVKHLVELHGGEVEAESEGPGRGSMFTIRLPAAATQPEPPPAAAKPSQTSLRGVRVLVVDDDVSARELFAAFLRAEGATVETAASAAEALDILERVGVDCVVSDLDMPGVDGRALISAIRASSALRRRLPALALTAHGGDEEGNRARAAGFQMHVARPVTPEQLVHAVAGILETDEQSVSTSDCRETVRSTPSPRQRKP